MNKPQTAQKILDAEFQEIRAKLLQVAAPAAVLRMRRLTLAADRTPVEWVLSTYRGDRYSFRTTLSARVTS